MSFSLRPFPTRGGFYREKKISTDKKGTKKRDRAERSWSLSPVFGVEPASKREVRRKGASCGVRAGNKDKRGKEEVEEEELSAVSRNSSTLFRTTYEPLPRYLALSSTLPDAGRFISTDTTNILIRNLTHARRRAAAPSPSSSSSSISISSSSPMHSPRAGGSSARKRKCGGSGGNTSQGNRSGRKSSLCDPQKRQRRGHESAEKGRGVSRVRV